MYSATGAIAAVALISAASAGANDVQDLGQNELWVTSTMMNDKVLKFDPVYDNFSKNDHLEYYKQNLVKTKNVDRIIPFRHSNNYRGK